MDRALDANMPRDTLERAIKRGGGTDQDGHFDSIRYEGYGPGGAAVIVECLTDNRTRTVGEVRHALTKHGGNLGTDGSVAFLFTRCGVLLFAPGSDEDRIMEAALEAGADDVQRAEDGSIEVLTGPDEFLGVKAAMAAAGLEAAQAEITQRASTAAPLSGDTAQAMQKLLDMLEDLDDVQAVHSNAEWG
jgi:YebC/PmpR family DNA-binding regulatory protein